MIYFKSDLHKKHTYNLLKKFNENKLENDVYIGAFAYLVGAVFKADRIEKMIYDDGTIEIEGIYNEIKYYSTSEKAILRFALQLFNSSIDNIMIVDVMQSLDSKNIKAVKQAIDIRFP